MNILSLLLATTLSLETSAQVLGPSLWSWGYTNITSYTIYQDTPIPHERSNSWEVPSACGGQSQGQVGFTCPHMFMFSSDMLLAAAYDNLDSHFFYATGTGNSDTECGKCYQIKLRDPEYAPRNATLEERQLILQITNSGFDVVSGQFDVLIAAGGFGHYTACNADCKTHFCNGGPCAAPLYSGSFEQWNPSPASNPCYSGGMKVFSDDIDEVWRTCSTLTSNPNPSSYKDQVLIQACWYSNILRYHQNFASTDSLQVRCPEGLTLLTGLKRSDDAGLPQPDLNNHLPISCHSGRGPCYTTYCDCAKPSCAWNNKGSPDNTFSRVDTCDSDGFIFGYSYQNHHERS